jgi:hypothetical protein
MHRDLPRIKRAHSHGAKGAAGTQPGYQSCASIIYQVRTAETSDETGVIGTVELRVVQQIGGLRGNLQLESLGDGKSSPESEVDVEAAGPANISACLRSVAIPVLIWDNTSVLEVLKALWHLQGLAWNSVYAGSDVSGVAHGNGKR